jgi:ribosomal protein S18 acetylase RimI-like enzyme
VAGALTFRPIQPADEPFLREVYASTRENELRLFGWSPDQQQAFLRLQFDAQQSHYRTHFPDAEFSLVLQDGVPVGRFYLYRGTTEYRIIDIALLTASRGQGIGTAVLEAILIESDRAGKPVTIHVERSNPALRLYERLGFQRVEEGPIYLLMSRPACPALTVRDPAG